MIWYLPDKEKKKEEGEKKTSPILIIKSKREREREKKGERTRYYKGDWRIFSLRIGMEIRIELLSGFAKFRTRVEVDYITNRSPSSCSSSSFTLYFLIIQHEFIHWYSTRNGTSLKRKINLRCLWILCSYDK